MHCQKNQHNNLSQEEYIHLIPYKLKQFFVGKSCFCSLANKNDISNSANSKTNYFVHNMHL